MSVWRNTVFENFIAKGVFAANSFLLFSYDIKVLHESQITSTPSRPINPNLRQYKFLRPVTFYDLQFCWLNTCVLLTTGTMGYVYEARGLWHTAYSVSEECFLKGNIAYSIVVQVNPESYTCLQLMIWSGMMKATWVLTPGINNTCDDCFN